jgi:GT2 family glycosyltransferase
MIFQVNHLLQLSGNKPIKNKLLNLMISKTNKSAFKESSPLVSIIILNWNGLDILEPCLNQVIKTIDNIDCEIIVYDNGSSEKGIEKIISKFPSIKLFKSDINFGFAGGNNRAAQKASGKYIIFLNNDTLPQSGWLGALTSLAESDSSIGLVGAKIMNDNGTIQNAGAYFDPAINTYAGPYRGYPKDYPAAQIIRDCEVYIACAVLIKRSLFNLVKGFDESYFQGYEDYDICLKIRQAGYRVLYCPEAEVIHFAETSTKRLDIKIRRRIKRQNTKIFFNKWKNNIGSLRLPEIVPEEMTPFNYYTKTRKDLIDFIPYGFRKTLEIGCGAGVLSSDLKKQGKASIIWGVELDPEAGRSASSVLNGVIIGDFLKVPLNGIPNPLDAVICADVIEHMTDPWGALDRINTLLKPGGEVIMSIPNIRHYKIIKKLIKNQWFYEKEGILDKTHLRFFTLPTLIQLLNYSGFEIIDIFRKKRARPWVIKLGRFFPALEEFLVYQYLIRARKI